MTISPCKIFAGWGQVPLTDWGQVPLTDWGHGRIASSASGADPDHDPDPGIFNGIFTTER